ncbi:MmcQ/YjbR family DNA-binding protein [Streptomyces californicus]|uniref:MmcQ/YjbR family DNA-binding protein n=1 Tax=Streptomyces californicus TaxID=67351 RepID=UPI00371AD581
MTTPNAGPAPDPAPQGSDPAPDAAAETAPAPEGTLPSDVVHAHCMTMPHVTYDNVFGPQTTCYRVGGKIFLMLGQDADPQYATFSYDPEESLVLRATYPSVVPGYYSNKRLSNTVYYDGRIEPEQTLDWISESYAIVFAKLPRKVRDELAARPDA